MNALIPTECCKRGITNFGAKTLQSDKISLIKRGSLGSFHIKIYFETFILSVENKKTF